MYNMGLVRYCMIYHCEPFPPYEPLAVLWIFLAIVLAIPATKSHLFFVPFMGCAFAAWLAQLKFSYEFQVDIFLIISFFLILMFIITKERPLEKGDLRKFSSDNLK